MASLVKGVLGRAWALAVGWVLPTFISIQLILLLVAPTLTAHALMDALGRGPAADREATALFVAAVLGVVLAAAKTPLYRILEGYSLWPQRVADASTRRQLARRDGLLRRGKVAQ